MGGEPPLGNFSPPLEKCVGHNLKILDIFQKVWAPLGKLFAPPGVPSWLRAWLLAVPVKTAVDLQLLRTRYVAIQLAMNRLRRVSVVLILMTDWQLR